MSLTAVRSDGAAGRRWIGTEGIFEVRFKPVFVFIDGLLAFCDIARVVGKNHGLLLPGVPPKVGELVQAPEFVEKKAGLINCRVYPAPSA